MGYNLHLWEEGGAFKTPRSTRANSCTLSGGKPLTPPKINLQCSPSPCCCLPQTVPSTSMSPVAERFTALATVSNVSHPRTVFPSPLADSSRCLYGGEGGGGGWWWGGSAVSVVNTLSVQNAKRSRGKEKKKNPSRLVLLRCSSGSRFVHLSDVHVSVSRCSVSAAPPGSSRLLPAPR